jgi:hypothetical protein
MAGRVLVLGMLLLLQPQLHSWLDTARALLARTERRLPVKQEQSSEVAKECSLAFGNKYTRPNNACCQSKRPLCCFKCCLWQLLHRSCDAHHRSSTCSSTTSRTDAAGVIQGAVLLQDLKVLSAERCG